jgi:pyrroline-5-carboxylate reductase
LNGTLGLLGCGNMGSAILRGLIETGSMAPGQARVFDPDPRRQEEVKGFGVPCVDAPTELARDCDMLLLAVKPQMMEEALQALGPIDPARTLVISIAAGISIGFIQSRLGNGTRVVRVMPNTPALVRAGAAGIAPSANCTPDDARQVRAIFESVGIVEEVSESDMDVVTALSGSGPAYFFYLVECLAEAAEKHGLSTEQARRLAGHTLLGAGRLLAESGEPASTLREKVTSKGGTTAAALDAFRGNGFAGTVQAAVDAAAARSKELGR